MPTYEDYVPKFTIGARAIRWEGTETAREGIVQARKVYRGRGKGPSTFYELTDTRTDATFGAWECALSHSYERVSVESATARIVQAFRPNAWEGSVPGLAYVQCETIRQRSGSWTVHLHLEAHTSEPGRAARVDMYTDAYESREVETVGGAAWDVKVMDGPRVSFPNLGEALVHAVNTARAYRDH